MTDFEKELLEEMRQLRLQMGVLAAQVNKNEGSLQALVVQVSALDTKVDALPQVTVPEEKKSTTARDTGLTLSGGAVAAIITALAQHWVK